MSSSINKLYVYNRGVSIFAYIYCVCVWKFILDLVLVKINIVPPISAIVKVFQEESAKAL